MTTSNVEANAGIADRRDPRGLSNLTEILSCLSAFQSEEAELSNSLTQMLTERDLINSSLSRLNSLTPTLGALHREASLLSHKVEHTAQTAERVGGRVRSLDEEMGRVREAGDRVSHVLELKVPFFVIVCLYRNTDAVLIRSP